MAAGLATLAGFAAFAGFLSLPTGTGSTQFACLLLSSRQLSLQPVYNSASLGSSFHGSLSHHTLTQKDNRNERNFI